MGKTKNYFLDIIFFSCAYLFFFLFPDNIFICFRGMNEQNFFFRITHYYSFFRTNQHHPRVGGSGTTGAGGGGT
jgi:hypothetical protein